MYILPRVAEQQCIHTASLGHSPQKSLQVDRQLTFQHQSEDAEESSAITGDRQAQTDRSQTKARHADERRTMNTMSLELGLVLYVELRCFLTRRCPASPAGSTARI